MLRRWLLLVALGLLGLIGSGLAITALRAGPAALPVVQPGPLVVVSMPTLTWTDISAQKTPTLWTLARHGAVGALTTRVASAHSCSDESWLTFSAGVRSTFGHPGATCLPPPASVPGPHGSIRYPQWDRWSTAAAGMTPPARIGMLGTLLDADRQCISAAGPYAGLGAADESGVVEHYRPTYAPSVLKTCPITLIGLQGPNDQALASIVDHLPPAATVIVAGMADDSRAPVLHAVVVAGPGVHHGLLMSPSTRQPGFVQTIDLSALVLDRLGIAAPTLPEARSPGASPMTPHAAISQVRDLSVLLNLEYPFVPTFFELFLGGVAILAAVGLFGWARHRRRHPRTPLPRGLRAWFAWLGAMAACMPVATFLVGLFPWWDWPHPRVMLCGGVIAISAILTGLAFLGPWRRWAGGPMMFLVATTFVVIAEDVVHGSPLQFISVMGLQPQYGGRYYGQGNVGYAVFATCSLVLAAVLAGQLIKRGHRRLAAATVGVVGLTAVSVDGFPFWGADGGGPVALTPAFAFLGMSAAGMAITWRRVLAVIGVTAAIVGTFAVWDYLRPPRFRTHIGNFVAQTLKTGRPTGLLNIADENWHMLTSSLLNMSALLLVLVIVVVLVKPVLVTRPLGPLLDQVPFLANGLAAVAVCWLLGFFANDSGTAIPPTGLLTLVPLLTLAGAWLRRTPEGTDSSASTADVEADLRA